MKVAVTSANSLVGQMLVPRLVGQGHEVVALARKPVDLPARVVPDWTVSPRAREALLESDAVVHLSGEIQARSWEGYERANVHTTRLVAEALGEGAARRAVFISYPGADPRSANLFLRAKGQAERLLLESGKEAVIFRAHAIINTPQHPGPAERALITRPGGRVRTLGDGRQRIYTVYRPDVVDAVDRALLGGRAGVYDLAGPDELTVDGLIRLLNRDAGVRISHTPEWLAHLLARFVPDLPPAFVDLYFREYAMDASAAVREFDLKLSSLVFVWR